MRYFFTLFISLVFFQNVFSQNRDLQTAFDAINREVDQNSEAYSTLKTASEKIGHRLTGSENGKKAEEYAYSLLKSYGFSSVKYQPFEVESWSRGTIDVKIGADEAYPKSVKAVALAHSPVNANVHGELVDMENGLDEDYAAHPGLAKGKIVLVYLGVLPNSPDGTKSLHRSEKTAIAIKNGATGIIVINTVKDGVLLTGTASVTGKLISIPANCISYEDGMQYKEILEGQKLYTSIKMTNFSGLVKARNVIATIKGSDIPDEKIVVGGHLDSWDLATGAIDNGIGSFSVIDMARTFKALKLQPKRTIEFVLFMGEEEGLLGSKAYVENAVKDGSVNSIRFMCNYDMTNDPKGFSSSVETTKDLFTEMGSYAAKLDTNFKNTYRVGAGLHSDHQSFMLHGIPTGAATGGKLPNGGGDCYHADCDAFNLVDEAGMKRTVKFGSMLAFGLANVEVLPAKHMNDLETKSFLEKNNLKLPLQVAGEWRWKD